MVFILHSTIPYFRTGGLICVKSNSLKFVPEGDGVRQRAIEIARASAVVGHKLTHQLFDFM